MMIEIFTTGFDVRSRGNSEIIDITREVEIEVKHSRFIEGSCLIFVAGSTAGITTIEYEPGLLKDYPKFFERIIPSDAHYHHNETWNDGNGFSHVRASLQGCSITIPFNKGKLLLGTWQQIILVDFDNRSRIREIIVQITGIKSNEK